MTQPDDLSQVDFIPCRCGQPTDPGILVHRCPAPHQLRGDLCLVCCSWCGRAAPFVPVAMGGDSVMPEAIAAWNRLESAPTPAEARGEVTDAPPCPVHLTEASRAWAVAWETSANHHIATLARQLAEAKAECSLLTHKVITCGVAARHPDPNLSRTGAYAGEWNSNQAEDVRALRTRAEQAEAQLAQATARLAAVRQRLERSASGLVSEQYASGYREALDHIDAALQPKGPTNG